MTRKSGVWVDIKRAVIVKLEDDDRTFKTIDSEITTREREAGEGKKFGRFARQFISFENRKQRKQNEEEKRFFKSILDEVGNSGDLVLFGPSGIKHKLEKEINANKSLKLNLKSVEDADSMTDNQVAAWVSDYYKQ
jgi:hypothetical protein